jgi:hypothetical protein
MLWQVLSLLNIFIGFSGIVLILYGAIKEYKGHAYEPIEKTAAWVASIGTFLSLAILAASVYLPLDFEHPPLPISMFVTAPMVLVASGIAIIFTVLRSGNISTHIINGAGLIGICGALFRILPA